jgi:hypothetical protein
MAAINGVPALVRSVVKIAIVEKPNAAPISDSVATPRPGV